MNLAVLAAISALCIAISRFAEAQHIGLNILESIPIPVVVEAERGLSWSPARSLKAADQVRQRHICMTIGNWG